MQTTSRQHASDDERHGLLELAHPDLYRNNAFRILELPTTASSREITKQQKILKLQLKLGNHDSSNQNSSLLIRPPRDSDVIRRVSSRIYNPLTRIIEELFWVWPIGNPESDEALQFLKSNDVDRAISCWINPASNDAAKAIADHNLAVIYHALALDVEQIGLSSPLTEKMLKWRDYYWQQAYAHWYTTQDSDVFWAKMRLRVRQIDDPRLSAATVRRIRESMLETIVSVGAKLAVHSAKADQASDARRHVQNLRESRYPSSVIDKVLALETDSLVAGIKEIGDTALAAANEDPSSGAAEAEAILEQSDDHLRTIDAVLETSTENSAIAHDHVAKCIRGCVISYVNETNDWASGKTLIRKALEAAASEVLKARLQEDLETLQGNLDGEANSEASELVGKASEAMERGDFRLARRHLTLALNTCQDESYRSQIKSWLDNLGAPSRPVYTPSTAAQSNWKPVAWVFGIIMAIAVISNADSCNQSSRHSARGSSSSQAYSRSTRSTPARGNLGAQIDSEKAEAQRLERQLASLSSQIDVYKEQIDGFERRVRLGIYVNEVAYEAVLDRHNALVREFNSVLANYRLKVSTVNSMVNRYNRGER